LTAPPLPVAGIAPEKFPGGELQLSGQAQDVIRAQHDGGRLTATVETSQPLMAPESKGAFRGQPFLVQAFINRYFDGFIIRHMKEYIARKRPNRDQRPSTCELRPGAL